MQVRWLAKAPGNLDDEAEFIARDDPAAARAFVRRIHYAVDNLKVNPAAPGAFRERGNSWCPGRLTSSPTGSDLA